MKNIILSILICLTLNISQTSAGIYYENGVVLNGTDEYFEIPEEEAQIARDNFSISAWVKTDESRLNEETKQREILTRNGSNISFGYEYETVEYKIWLRCYIRYEDGTSQEVEWRDMGDQITRDGNWHQFKVEFKKNDYFKLYIDEKLVDSEKTPDKNINISKKSNDFTVGARKKTDGTIDRNIKAEIKNIEIF